MKAVFTVDASVICDGAGVGRVFHAAGAFQHRPEIYAAAGGADGDLIEIRPLHPIGFFLYFGALKFSAASVTMVHSNHPSSSL